MANVMIDIGPGWEGRYLPLPSGKLARVRLLTRYVPPLVIVDESADLSVADLEALAEGLRSLARELKHPEGVWAPGH